MARKAENKIFLPNVDLGFSFVKVDIITENQEIIFQTDYISRKKQQLIAARGGCSVSQSCLTLVTLWSIAWQASLSMGFPRQEQWSGLPFSFSRGSSQWVPFRFSRDRTCISYTGRWILYQLSHQVKYFLKNIPNAFAHCFHSLGQEGGRDWGCSMPQDFPWRKIFIFLFIYC